MRSFGVKLGEPALEEWRGEPALDPHSYSDWRKASSLSGGTAPLHPDLRGFQPLDARRTRIRGTTGLTRSVERDIPPPHGGGVFGGVFRSNFSNDSPSQGPARRLSPQIIEHVSDPRSIDCSRQGELGPVPADGRSYFLNLPGRCGRRPMLSRIRHPIRRSSPPRPTRSISASPGSQVVMRRPQARRGRNSCPPPPTVPVVVTFWSPTPATTPSPAPRHRVAHRHRRSTRPTQPPMGGVVWLNRLSFIPSAEPPCRGHFSEGGNGS